VRKRQDNLVEMLEKLKRKFYEKEKEWEQDFAKEIAKYSKEVLMTGDEIILSAGDINDSNLMNKRTRR
jgi:ABC-type Zn uptake system ZnuABC Zn-binding protein ZnuA